MGWNTGNEIFNPVATEVVDAVKKAWLAPAAGVRILETLANVLKSEDWDTFDESRDLFRQYSVVVDALDASEKRWAE